GLARVAVGTVAAEAGVRHDRPDVAVETDSIGRSGGNGGERPDAGGGAAQSLSHHEHAYTPGASSRAIFSRSPLSSRQLAVARALAGSLPRRSAQRDGGCYHPALSCRAALSARAPADSAGAAARPGRSVEREGWQGCRAFGRQAVPGPLMSNNQM